MDKHGIAFLLKYLYENTDQDNPVTSGQLQSVLAEKGYASNPRTIRKDAGLLADAGFDVMIIEQPGLPTEYYYNARDFELTEARVLIDAVSSAQFITQKQTDELIEKLSVLAGRQHKAALKPQLYVSEHIKAENDQLLLTIEKIHQSILGRKKIAFRMFNYDTNMKKNFRHGGEVYTISPYNTVWNDDRYYVVGYSDKRQDIVSMRIDRMAIPEILDEDAFPPPENYNVQDYTDTISRMYGGSREEVTLRCCTAMIDQVIDKFGKKVRLSIRLMQPPPSPSAEPSWPGSSSSPGRSQSSPRNRSGRCMRKCFEQPWPEWRIRPYVVLRNPGIWSGNCKRTPGGQFLWLPSHRCPAVPPSFPDSSRMQN